VKKGFICFACVALALALAGCTTGFVNTTGSVSPYGLELVRMDYEVIGDTTAEASRTAILGIDWAHLTKDEGAPVDNSLLSFIPNAFSPLNGAKSEANLAALRKIPTADRLVDPRYEIKTSTVFFGVFVTKVTVKVTAKAVKYTKSAPGAK
jgi:hypothetical protein